MFRLIRRDSRGRRDAHFPSSRARSAGQVFALQGPDSLPLLPPQLCQYPEQCQFTKRDSDLGIEEALAKHVIKRRDITSSI